MFQFNKSQKLCCKKSISRLFESGRYIEAHPLKVVWSLDQEKDSGRLKSVIIVPKKKIKLAADRNLIKRRIKEGYRIEKNKIDLHLEDKGGHLNLAIIYQYEEILEYSFLKEKINLILGRLLRDL